MYLTRTRLYTHTHTSHSYCVTSHVCSSNQLAHCCVGAGAAGQSQGVAEQTEAVVAGDAPSQPGLQEHPGLRHLACIPALTDTHTHTIHWTWMANTEEASFMKSVHNEATFLDVHIWPENVC